jgi:ATP-dependent DNA helicase DinG
MLREHFHGTPRPIQEQVLQQIEEALQQGYHNIVISAPTGVGKSYIAVCLALAFKEADILTATVQLQEQYLRDFKFIRPLMGRKNFTCPIYDNKPCSIVPTVRCRGMKRTVGNGNGNGSSSGNNGSSNGSVGVAVVGDDEDVEAVVGEGNGSSNGSSSNNNSSPSYIIPECSLYPTRDDIKRIYVLNKGTSNEKVTFNAGYRLCEYYLQKYLAYRSSFRIINYHEYFTLVNNFASKNKLSTKLLVCDEAHMLEEKVIDFYNVSIDNQLLNPLRKNELIDKNITVEYRPEEDKDYYKQLLATIVKGYKDLLNITAELIGRSSLHESEKRKLMFRLAEYEERLQRLTIVLEMLKWYPDNFIVDAVVNKRKKNLTTVKLLPLNISPFLRPVFDRVKYRIFMSATIDYPMLKRELGLEDTDTILIDLPSPFPVENRKVILMNAYTLNRENMSDERTLMQVSSIIDSLMSKHSNEKGLILTTSYELAGNIFRYSNNKHRLLLTKDMSAKEVLEKHVRTNANVILTPTMWEGVDLRDDLCRFIIIAKTPYPSLADKRIKVKAERDKDWYYSVTLMRLIQGCGRGVRHEKDYCITYILDSNATWLIKGKMKQNAVPRWFKDALVYNKNNS